MDNTAKQTPAAEQQAAGLYPGKPGFAPTQQAAVGGVLLADTPIEYNTGRKTVRLVVRNTGDRPIQVGSHFHFFEVNRYLEFDRDAAFGCHLNIPATTAIRFEPGDQKEVEVVAYAGKRRVIGFNGLVMGYTGDEDAPTYFPARLKAVRKVREAGFKEIAEKDAEAAYAKQQAAAPHNDNHAKK
ncbi:MAG: urease subunit beta [Alistipes sp.]|nr:urease subunit beta [Alistipes sp.]